MLNLSDQGCDKANVYKWQAGFYGKWIKLEGQWFQEFSLLRSWNCVLSAKNDLLHLLGL
jgi:hypothetical protein